MAARVVISCEHASNRVPAAWRELFDDAGPLLESHRGLDIGAAGLARRMARAAGAPLHLGAVTRLLVDLNRSEHHRGLFSQFSRRLRRADRMRLLESYYNPYRDTVERDIEAGVSRGRCVVHVSVHSFTPELDGIARRCDVGLLYDPRRTREKRLALAWQGLLSGESELKARRNYPYTGVQDGFVPWLRKRFPARLYLGLELEVNQRLAAGGQFPAALERLLAGTFLSAVGRAGRDKPQPARR